MTEKSTPSPGAWRVMCRVLRRAEFDEYEFMDSKESEKRLNSYEELVAVAKAAKNGLKALKILHEIAATRDEYDDWAYELQSALANLPEGVL